VTWEFSAECACVQNTATQEKGLESNANIYPHQNLLHTARKLAASSASPTLGQV
jgi:hypothetical protein